MKTDGITCHPDGNTDEFSTRTEVSELWITPLYYFPLFLLETLFNRSINSTKHNRPLYGPCICGLGADLIMGHLRFVWDLKFSQQKLASQRKSEEMNAAQSDSLPTSIS